MTQPTHRHALIALMAAATAITACDLTKKETSEEAEPDEAKATATAKTKASAAVAPTADPNAALALAASVARVVPDGRSAVPTLAEWNSVEREVTVKGSSALNCETKMV
ncbi:MAG: hypothetical protein JRI68_08925, partial [Deltaproteobacteria bacterium]|nr:hypothetical protein [Deltaproteobacteria bacterium]